MRLARNKVVENAEGDYLAFIDDDEFPCNDVAAESVQGLHREYDVDGVLGPVLRHFDETPPKWIEKSNFYVRRVNPTGMRVEWLEARTGNVLLKRELIDGDPAPFRPEFRAGEDQDFFRRKIAEGRNFIWCAEAEAFETVPPARWKQKVFLRKALLRGATAGLHTNTAGVVKSLIAIPLYTLALPFALLAGQQYFMTLLVKICDHLGKLLILIGHQSGSRGVRAGHTEFSLSANQPISASVAGYRYVYIGEVAVGKAAARASAAVGNHPGVRIPSLSATFFDPAVPAAAACRVAQS